MIFFSLKDDNWLVDNYFTNVNTGRKPKTYLNPVPLVFPCIPAAGAEISSSFGRLASTTYKQHLTLTDKDSASFPVVFFLLFFEYADNESFRFNRNPASTPLTTKWFIQISIFPFIWNDHFITFWHQRLKITILFEAFVKSLLCWGNHVCAPTQIQLARPKRIAKVKKLIVFG